MSGLFYDETAAVLVQRIAALIPAHPEILILESPWDLFKIAGFTCSDLQPSMYQAAWALRQAQQAHKRVDA